MMGYFSGRIGYGARVGVVGSLALATLASISARAAEYKVDKDHSHVGFTVRHLIGRVHGEFKDFSGGFSFDARKPSADKVTFTVQTDSVSTDNLKRDNHLKSPDFFDVAKYPAMTFESTEVTPDGHDKYKVKGKLTLRGVTRPVVFHVDYLGTAKDPWGNTRSGFTATTAVNRKDFGMVWNKILDAGALMVGNKVDVKLDVEAVEEAPPQGEKSAKKAKS